MDKGGFATQRLLLAIGILVLLAGVGPGRRALALEPDAACQLEEGPAVTVARVIDAETLALTDRSEVRLIGALAPRGGEGPGEAVATPAERQAVAVLEGLVLGRTVMLGYAGRRTDRYGRQLAHVFVERDRARLWVQGELVARGLARAYGLPGNFACGRDLNEREERARAARLGLWTEPGFAVRDGSDTRQLARDRNSFQIVEGRVAAVSEAYGEVSLALSGGLEADAERGFSARVVLRETHIGRAEMKGLQGRRVRVRGWIEQRPAPLLRILDRSQLEILPDAPAESAQDLAR